MLSYMLTMLVTQYFVLQSLGKMGLKPKLGASNVLGAKAKKGSLCDVQYLAYRNFDTHKILKKKNEYACE